LPPPRQELRQRTDAIGRPIYLYQCLDCGAATTSAIAVAKAMLAAQGRKIEPFDEPLREKGWAEEQRLYDMRRKEAHELFKQRQLKGQQGYDAYLLTDAWRAKRAQAFARDRGVCQGCFQRPATQVHHLTYAHLGDELLFELMSVCDDCHTRIHGDKQIDTRPAYDDDGNALNYDEEDEPPNSTGRP
jgi:hypothetical protein